MYDYGVYQDLAAITLARFDRARRARIIETRVLTFPAEPTGSPQM